MTRYNEVTGNALIQRHLPVLGQVAAVIGDNQVRNRGTLGGSIANADPAADLPAALLAMKASVNTQTDKYRQTSFFSTCSKQRWMRVILWSVWISRRQQAAYEKFRHPASGYAVVGVLVACFSDGVRVGVTGAGPVHFAPAPWKMH